MKYSINILTAILIAMSFIFVSCSSDKDEPEYIANELIGFWQSDPFLLDGVEVVMFFEFDADKTYKMAVLKNKNQPFDDYKNDIPIEYHDGTYRIEDGQLHVSGWASCTMRVKGDRLALYARWKILSDEQPIFNSYYAFTRIKDSEEEEEPFETQTFTVDGLTYISEDGKTATLTYRDGSDSPANSYAGLTSAQIPSTVTCSGRTFTVTSIGECAFLSCRSLTSVTIPNSVTSIGDGAFYGSGLTELTIPASVKTLGQHAFASCKMTEVSIPQSVTSIGKSAFSYCTKIETLSIGKNVITIGDLAFYGCKNLNTVTNYATTPQSISENVFSNKGTLKVPEASLSTYKSTPVWSGFESIVKI